MQKQKHLLIAFTALSLSFSAFAMDNANSSDTVSAEHRGMSDSGSASSADAGQAGQNVAMPSQTKSNDLSDTQKAAVKTRLGPQAIGIQTELLSATDEVKGLKAQLGAIQSGSNSHWLESNSRKISGQVAKVAKMYTALETQVTKYPSIASSSDYKSFTTAFNDVKTLNRTWQAQASNSAYWLNTKQAMNDLDELQKRLENAFDKAKGFGSSQLDVSSVG